MIGTRQLLCSSLISEGRLMKMRLVTTSFSSTSFLMVRVDFSIPRLDSIFSTIKIFSLISS
jgi:hypothetical protein